MAKWMRHLALQPEWGQAQEDEISYNELSAIIAKRLDAIAPFVGQMNDIEYRKTELVDAFVDASRDPDLDVEEFDNLMADLYDWGDIALDNKWNGQKVCWIDTMGVRQVSP